MAEGLPIHEREFVRAFIIKAKQERCNFLLSNPDRRQKFRNALPHFKWLDERFAHAISPKVAHTAAELVALMRSKGAGRMVWVISEDSAIDGREMSLEDAMETKCGSQQGTILSCIPGKLAYFRDEEMHSQRLLQRS
ncbi:MAG TPA: hypothetical protein VFL96_05975 [Acidobacteriaceae bacterium]|nr:hypothetical protein [Acidobacteriaceae bacterium]